MKKEVFCKNYYKLGFDSFLYAVVLMLLFSLKGYSQCSVPVGCATTDLSNFGSNSNTNAATIEYDNYISSFHSSLVRSTTGLKVWGEKMANDGVTAVLSPLSINATNFPALGTSIPLKGALGSSFNGNIQGIVLSTDGLYAWGVGGIVLDASITSSSTFQKITIGGNATGLPIGITPADIKMLFATSRTLALTTCSGAVWVLSQDDTARGMGDSYLGSTGNATTWYRVTTTAVGNPYLTNVVACRGSAGNLMALRSDGSVYVWGRNVYLGDNTAAVYVQSRATQMVLPVGVAPKMIGSTNATTDSGATFYVLATDGKLFALGRNTNHQLGNWSATESFTWVRPRYNSSAGPFMDNILWISPQEHDESFPAINVINANYNLFAFGSNKENMIGGPTLYTDPVIPNGLTTADLILSVETGGHTSMVVKQCNAKFGYVGHRINGSMADGTTNDAYEPAYTFNTAALEICGVESGLTIQPKIPGINGSYSNYCSVPSIELETTPAGGTLSLVSGPATLAANTLSFTGAGSVTVKYVVASLCNGTNEVLKTFTVVPNSLAATPSTTPTLCINTALTSITHSTTGVTGIGTATGLPTGVTASFASNTITISGTPTASGVFNYSIPLIGDCGTATATGTITVTANNTVTTPSTTPTLCINTALTSITHSTTGATGIGTATGLPTGITASFASNTITISGTPTAAGVFNYSIPLTGGCGAIVATGTITVTANNTVTTPSTTPTLCINTALTSITHSTTGATGIGTATGLPTGVTASFASNTITISGTPTAAGVFNYSIPLTGGCGAIVATGTITVTANNTVTTPSTTPTLCINTALTSITHSTTGATGIGTATGLPTGVTASFASNTITISGTPTAAGVFNYSIPLTGGCGAIVATGTITVTALPTLSIDDVTVSEANVNANFTVSLNNAVSCPVSFVVSTINGTATSPIDFTAINNVTYIIPPGDTFIQVSVPILSDNVLEGDEDYIVNISSATNATILDSDGKGIINENPSSNATVSIVKTTDGVEPATDGLFTVSLNNPVSTPTTVTYTVSGTATA
ncbi:hypothetical protein LPBF_09250, partial [Flavobacterium crassostreae]